MTAPLLAIWGVPGPTLVSTGSMSCSSTCSMQSDIPALAPPRLGQLGGTESPTFPVPSPSWKSHWCIQLGRVSTVLSGSLVELSGTTPPLAHAHCPSGPLIRTGPAAPAFNTSRQQVGINLWVCIYASELQGTCFNASKTPSPHTLVKVRFPEGRMTRSVIQALVIGISLWHFHLFGAVLTFPKHSKITQWAPLLHWIYTDSASLDPHCWFLPHY